MKSSNKSPSAVLQKMQKDNPALKELVKRFGLIPIRVTTNESIKTPTPEKVTTK